MDTADQIVRPQHYTHYSIEPIDYIMQNNLPFYKGSVIKYVSRAGHKLYPNMDITQSELMDLNKAIRFCQIRIEQIEAQGNK